MAHDEVQKNINQSKVAPTRKGCENVAVKQRWKFALVVRGSQTSPTLSFIRGGEN